MSKRTPGLKRNDRDFYPTPEKAVLPLVRHLAVGATYWEPCLGEGDLVRALHKHGMVTCVGASDTKVGAENLTREHIDGAELFITNPPWAAKTLHPIIRNLVPLLPTWLLLPSDWLFTRQAVEFHPWVRQIVTMPRVVWISGTSTAGFDNCCWVYFEEGKSDFLTSGWP